MSYKQGKPTMPMSRAVSEAKLLGFTQEQRGSELQAAARAELIPTPETRALSSRIGRVFAKLARRVGISQELQNYFAFRPFGMMEMLKRGIPAGCPQPHILDPLGGYTPQMLWLARDLPHARVYEIDLPDVIQDKAKRLRNAKDVVIPPNLTWYGANLYERSLSEVLKGQKMHVIIGMGAFLTPPEYVRLLHYLGENLTPDGAIVGNLPWKPGMTALAESSLLYRVQVGPLPGATDDLNQVRGMFYEAGFYDVSFTNYVELAQALRQPTPANLELLILARR